MKKRPILSLWKDYQNRRPSIDELLSWFENPPEDAQIALVTGKISGVSVVDIDCHKEGCAAKKGGTCACSPEDPADLLGYLGATLWSRTGSGGYHAFFQYDKRLNNSVGIAHPQYDIRSDGGIIILPPSVHQNGEDYEWKATWNAVAISSLPPFPPFLFKMLNERPKADWRKIVEGVGEGRRNVSAAALAGKLCAAFKPEEYDCVWSLMCLWNEHRVSPPLSARELEATFKSVANAEASKRAKYGGRR